ncbi:1-acyl-sn-glycerol-3-phosphate acyltransferase, partial [Pseudomonas shirazica]|uniref:1-acyl-sn-glycerol-3-phosphate acyltransferase n=1 Tax=Pseudomonas shirazica TaxID=1940636 RepID=UPI0015D5DDFA
HTSNYDFIFAMAGFYKLKLPVNYLIKQRWTDHFLLKGIFKNTGAIGIKREENHSMVETIVKTIRNQQGNLHIMISPE